MSFQKLSLESLQSIRPFLQNKFPKSAMMLNILDMTVSGKYPDEDNVNIYGYNGVSSADEMFLDAIIKAKGQDAEYSIIYAPEVITNDMIIAFSKSHDWTKNQEFGAAPIHFVEILEKLVKEKGGNLSKGPAHDMYLPVQSALELDLEQGREHLKENFAVDKLSPEHAAKVNAHWKYGGEGYDRSIAEAIRAFGAAGIFKNRNGSNGRTIENLVSWVILMRLGTLNALHTLDEYRCQGLGRWTMEAASKWVAQEGLIPLCEIEPYNSQSKCLVEKIGYKFIQEVCWMRFTPPETPSSSV